MISRMTSIADKMMTMMTMITINHISALRYDLFITIAVRYTRRPRTSGMPTAYRGAQLPRVVQGTRPTHDLVIRAIFANSTKKDHALLPFRDSVLEEKYLVSFCFRPPTKLLGYAPDIPGYISFMTNH